MFPDCFVPGGYVVRGGGTFGTEMGEGVTEWGGAVYKNIVRGAGTNGDYSSHFNQLSLLQSIYLPVPISFGTRGTTVAPRLGTLPGWRALLHFRAVNKSKAISNTKIRFPWGTHNNPCTRSYSFLFPGSFNTDHAAVICLYFSAFPVF